MGFELRVHDILLEFHEFAFESTLEFEVLNLAPEVMQVLHDEGLDAFVLALHVAPLDLNHVVDEVVELISTTLGDGQEVGIAVALEQPQPQIIIEYEINTKEFTHATILKQQILDAQVEVGHLAVDLGEQEVLQPSFGGDASLLQ